VPSPSLLEPANIDIIQIAKYAKFGRQIGNEVLAYATCDLLAVLTSLFVGGFYVQGNGSHSEFIH
jgi:hypothetical protein